MDETETRLGDVESGRLAALKRTALLDSPAEPAFDRLARLASDVLKAPAALVALVDEDRQFLKCAIGFPEPWATSRETPLSHSFCKYVVETRGELVIEDARVHPLVAGSPAIEAFGAISYAGMPLTTAEGHVLGSLCVIDHEPRRWTDDELTILRDLAAAVVTEIELRLRTDEAEELLSEVVAAAQVRRTKALEINDLVLQNIAAAKLALGRGGTADALASLDAAIAAVREIVHGLMPAASPPGDA